MCAIYYDKLMACCSLGLLSLSAFLGQGPLFISNVLQGHNEPHINIYFSFPVDLCHYSNSNQGMCWWPLLLRRFGHCVGIGWDGIVGYLTHMKPTVYG